MYPYQNPSLSAAERAADLLARMTITEKIGQLYQINVNPENFEKMRDLVSKGLVGSMILHVSNLPSNMTGSEPHVFVYNTIQKAAVENSRLSIPVIHGRDIIHGHQTVFPIPLALAASFSPEAMEETNTVAAREAAASGVNWSFAPMMDIARDARWGRVAEGFGEDPYLGSKMAAAAVRGFQGDDPSAPDRVLACAKHYVGYGGAEGGRDYNTVEISDNTLRNVYFPPFKAAVDAGVATVMSAFHDLNGIPTSGSHYLLTEVLKEEFGFEGFVVSDWAAVAEMIRHRFAADERDAAEKAFNAGLDMEMVSECYIHHLADLVAEGKVSMDRIDDACRRILTAKFLCGLFDHPFADEAEMKRILYAPEHQQSARRIAQQTLVLLKNQSNLLPLAVEDRKVAVVGPYANQRRGLFGSWTLHGVAENTQSLHEAFSEALPGQVLPAVSDALVDEMIRRVHAADVVVLAVGESDWRNGENNCVASIDLPAGQDELIEAICNMGKPVVLVVFGGRPLNLSRAVRYADAILYAWHPGSLGAAAVVDTLLGREVPTGKLPITFPRTTGQIPVHYNYKSTGRDNLDVLGRDMTANGYTEVERYLDVASSPLFSFGFGLSYTTFAYSDLSIVSSLDGARVSVTVLNTGTREGVEIAQCYVQDCVASVTRPVRELKGFQRVALLPGEAKRVEFALGTAELGFYNQQGKFVVEPGAFRVWVGGDCRASLEGRFTIS